MPHATVLKRNKFTETGSITVSVRPAEPHEDGAERLHFRVSDTGVGIPREKLDAIFESFVQLDGSATRSYSGTGLGLAISRRLVELLGGTIWAQSEVGHGSTFHFTIKARLAGASQGQHRRPASPANARQAATARGARAEQGNGPGVLVVEDDPAAADLITTCLRKAGYRCAVADNGAAALALARTRPPLAVILDLVLPVLDGFEVLKELRQREATRHVPILVNTARDLSADDIRRLNGQYDVILQKTATNLTDVVARVACLLGTIHAAARRAPTAAPNHGPTILVAEDNPTNRALTRMILEKNGYQVVVAEDGQQAIEAVECHPVDLVLMDVQMPRMDGFEAIRRIRQMKRHTRLPIVALTARAMKGDATKCFVAGGDAYLSKPVDPDELLDLIARSLPGAKTDPPGPPEPPDTVAGIPQNLEAIRSLSNERHHELLASVEDAIAEFENALEVNDVTTIGFLGRRLGRAGAQAGLDQLAQLAHRVERAAQHGDIDALPALLVTLREQRAQLEELAHAE